MRENYQAWNINIDDFHGLKDDHEKLRFLLKFAVLAPSSHNTQPWRFQIENNRIDVLADPKRRLLVSDRNDRQLFISLGCAIENILTAAYCYGYGSEVIYFPDNSFDQAIASIELREDQETMAKDAFSLGSLINRVTNRGKYKKDLPPENFLEKIQELADDRVRVDLLTGDKKNLAAEIAVEAAIEAMNDPEFRRELSSYVKNNFTRSKTGIPCFGMGIPDPISLLAPFLIKYINLNKLSKKKDEDLLKNHTPAIIVLSTPTDTKEDWLRAGQVYEKINLEAYKIQLATAMWAAPIQISDFYRELQKVTNTDNRPQALFRLGYPVKEVRHSPRLTGDELVGRTSKITDIMKEQSTLIGLINVHIESQYIEVNNHRIHYTKSGSGAPLLLIHGLNIGWGQWHNNIGQLSQHFTVYAVDTPGAGLSDRLSDYNIDLENTMVETLEKFISILRLNEVNIVGHSLGGWTALRLVLRKKVRINKIVLVSPMGLTRTVPWRFKPLSIYILAKLISTTIVKKSRKRDMHNFLTSVIYERKGVSDEFVNYFFAAMQPHKVHPFMLIHRLTGFFNIRKELILIDQLSRISRPVLIIVGEQDPIVRAVDIHKTHKLIPNAKLEVFLNTGHLPFMEKKIEFNDLVISFLLA